LEKLLVYGAGWLPQHPEKEQIARRYLRHRSSLLRQALARLVDESLAGDEESPAGEQQEELLEKPQSLNDQRLAAVLAALRASEARSVLDLGCGEGRLLQQLLADKQFDRIVGMDVSIRALETAQRRLKLERLPERQAERIELIHGSLMYRDQRFSGFDAAAVVEVIEHLDPPRLSALERVLFEFARPRTVVLTTPNREYNVKWETLPAGRFRHGDHRFEWSRKEFQLWASKVAAGHGYTVRFMPIGPEDEVVGPATQMGVFARE
jgi:3' terminal RNA ribose 2'-O-methyltransferase Hen1